jgi:hypothetical protein
MESSEQIIKRAKLFEFYARYLWPLQRPFVLSQISKRCRKCVLSEKFSAFENGICEYCRSQTNPSEALNQDTLHTAALAESHQEASTNKDSRQQANSNESAELENVLRSYEGKGPGLYDATVLLSGGKDSALLLHRLKTRHPKLRLLGVSVDNGYMSPVAKSNIDFLLKKLTVDHLFVKPDLEFSRKTFRHALLSSRKRGGYDVVDRMAGDMLHDIGRHVAATYQTPLLLTGMSRTQVQKIFGVFHWEMPRERESQARLESANFILKDLFTESEMRHWWNPKLHPTSQVHRLLFPLYAWNLNEQSIRQEVTELGLIVTGQDSPLVTNDALIPVMGVVDVVNLGYSSFEPEFAQMVREGKTDRQYWLNIYELLEYCGKTGWLLGDDVKAVLKDLQLSPSELGIEW